jgi:hypothetical protein
MILNKYLSSKVNYELISPPSHIIGFFIFFYFILKNYYKFYITGMTAQVAPDALPVEMQGKV